MRDLVDIHYPRAERIRVVLDNLSTHSAFPADEARRVLRRLEFHYVRKRASWLNMVEIEIGVLAHQCLDRRRDRCLGNTAQCRTRPRQVDVHNRKGPRQNGPVLPKTRCQITPSSTSQNLCVEVLAEPGQIKHSGTEQDAS
jgi:hypothetical protein